MVKKILLEYDDDTHSFLKDIKAKSNSNWNEFVEKCIMLYDKKSRGMFVEYEYVLDDIETVLEQFVKRLSSLYYEINGEKVYITKGKKFNETLKEIKEKYLSK